MFIKFKIVLAVIVLVCIIGLLFFNNSKLASKKGGSTKIAYWSFNENIKSNNSLISLADTITNKKYGVEDGYIAPGTEGKFDIVINAEKSNVKLEYKVNIINEKNTPSNLYFYLENSEKKYKTLSDLVNIENLSGIFEINSEKKKVYTINWCWPYESFNEKNNIEEEKIEIKEDLDYVFEIEISGKQII